MASETILLCPTIISSVSSYRPNIHLVWVSLPTLICLPGHAGEHLIIMFMLGGDTVTTVMIPAVVIPLIIPVALTLDDLAAIYSSLFEVRSKWFSIGLELGVDATKLTDIEREGSDDSKALRKMLMIVLKKQISGRRLCDTLRERVIDESVLANNLEVNLPRSIISRRQQTTNFTTRGIKINFQFTIIINQSIICT